MRYCDATFLTERFKGILMAATGVNGNQGFFPFAYALVPGEDIEGWEWIMENLKHCVDSRPITFITDRHEGLKQSIPKYFPNSFHSYCFYHLKNNFPIKKSHEKYKQVQDLFHKAAYCYSVSKYEATLNEMCIIGCVWVAKYIRSIDPKHWENAFFLGCRYGTHSSSIAESFNKWIHRERDLPPAALVDEMRIKIMRMSAERRELGRPWDVTESGNGIYEVHSPSSHVVDLMQMTCTCQRWKVFGFPCAHATAAITMSGIEMLRFIQPYFGSNHFRHTYTPAIRPIPKYDRPEAYEPEERVLPGIPRPPSGRPPKKRIRSAYEKERRPMKCSNCKNIGTTTKLPVMYSELPNSLQLSSSPDAVRSLYAIPTLLLASSLSCQLSSSHSALVCGWLDTSLDPIAGVQHAIWKCSLIWHSWQIFKVDVVASHRTMNL
ncbi:uncharacterized protein LOC113279151 [Papaver somniferum]|uniref:uncharacterized protein LOC113279151 n=1 Tax=Papaver somniferum TaxID=3469 RepID=UPI000E6F93FB|nr:uncharacterized protein LOC113279151 [Papaver somniferum]